MRVRVDGAGTIGIVQDVPGYELPSAAWTAGRNVRMQDGSVHKANGYEAFWTPPQVAPYFVMPVQAPIAYHWLYAGLNKVYSIQQQYHFDISRSGGYNASPFKKWQGTDLGGVIVLNNGIDVPQFWAFPIDQSVPLADLTNWPATDRASVVRSYKNFLVATNVTRSGQAYPTMVKWSHGADVGTVPTSWVIDDPTLDGGEYNLPQKGGEILEQQELGDITVLYRSEAGWGMQFVGAPAMFRFWRISGAPGILAQGCSEDFMGANFVVTPDDIVLFDGQQATPVADARMRKAFFSALNTTYFDRTFLVHSHRQKEMWICYPTSGAACDKALVWSYSKGSNAWALKDLPDIASAAWGVRDSGALDIWDAGIATWADTTLTWSDSGTWSGADGVAWDDDDAPWNFRAFDSQKLGLVYAAPDQHLYQGDNTNTNSGVNMTAYIERQGLSFGDKSELYPRVKVNAIYPHLEGTVGGVVNVYCGTQKAIGAEVVYYGPKPFTIGTDYKVDFTGSKTDGRLISVKFESTTDIEWRLPGYQLDIEVVGAY